MDTGNSDQERGGCERKSRDPLLAEKRVQGSQKKQKGFVRSEKDTKIVKAGLITCEAPIPGKSHAERYG